MKGMPCVAIAVAFLALHAGGAPLRLDDVDARAAWVLHVDGERLRTTEAGALLLQQLEAAGSREKLAAIQAIFNFDPRKDLDSVTVYGGEAKEGQEKQGVLLVRGRFEPTRLLTLIKAAEGYESSAYGKNVIHAWVDEKAKARAVLAGRPVKKTYGCFYTDTMVVLGGTREELQQALDVLDRVRPSVRGTELGRKLESLPQRALVVAAAIRGMVESEGIDSMALKAAKEITFFLTEDNGRLGAELGLVAGTADEAGAVKTILDGVLALSVLNAERDPLAAGLAKHVSLELEGAKLIAKLAYSVDDLKRDVEARRKIVPGSP